MPSTLRWSLILETSSNESIFIVDYTFVQAATYKDKVVQGSTRCVDSFGRFTKEAKLPWCRVIIMVLADVLFLC